MQFISSVKQYGGSVVERWASNDGFTFIVAEDEEKKVHIAIRNDVGYCTECIFEKFIKKYDNYDLSYEGCMPTIRCKKIDFKSVMDLLESIEKVIFIMKISDKDPLEVQNVR